jgi:site-specific DNA-methyltransferase (adenine-specific)
MSSRDECELMAVEGTRAPRNRTLLVSAEERERLGAGLIRALPDGRLGAPLDGTICGDCRAWLPLLPSECVDLLFLDPPYNLTKDFNGRKFSRMSVDEYTRWLSDLFGEARRLLKRTASVYVCGDWLSSQSIFAAASEHFVVRNRITWEREKGRGARTNWKNSSEDIWFCTASDEYTFNIDAVKLRRRVVAPYRHADGRPKDWVRDASGAVRDTHPSNLWTDITVPFWSMPENTDHPTQKSEKLLAKLLLASTNPGEFVLDPFLGSGTTSVVAKKLGRRFLGVELDEDYCRVAVKRLKQAESDPRIQGFADGVFWERNSIGRQRARTDDSRGVLF